MGEAPTQKREKSSSVSESPGGWNNLVYGSEELRDSGQSSREERQGRVVGPHAKRWQLSY